MHIIIEDKRIGEIPVLTMYDSQATLPVPILIMLHGFTSCKENHLKDAYRLAEKGYYVLLFDALRHGERQDSDFKRLSFFEKGRYLVDIEVNTSREISLIVEKRHQLMPGDPERIGLIGFSMGANTIFKYLTETIPSPVKAAVTLVATPCWAEAIRAFLDNQPNMKGFLTSLDFAAIQKVEPSGKLQRLTDFPLLMINCTQDDRVPIADVRAVYQQLKQQYTDKTCLRMIEYPDLGHRVIDEMLDHATDWFDKYLR